MVISFLSFVFCALVGVLLAGVFSALLYMANDSDYDFIQNKPMNKFREIFNSGGW